MQRATARATGTAREATEKALSDISAALSKPPRFDMAFASTSQPLQEVLTVARARLPGAVVMGCSTAGEFTETGDAKGSVSFFAVAGDIEAHAAFAPSLKADPKAAVRAAAAEVR